MPAPKQLSLFHQNMKIVCSYGQYASLEHQNVSQLDTHSSQQIDTVPMYTILFSRSNIAIFPLLFIAMDTADVKHF